MEDHVILNRGILTSLLASVGSKDGLTAVGGFRQSISHKLVPSDVSHENEFMTNKAGIRTKEDFTRITLSCDLERVKIFCWVGAVIKVRR